MLPAEVMALGERIHETLGGQDDFTSTWIALRIAELMTKVTMARTDEDRAAAAQTCQDLILAVWERRHHWPHGWPPKSVADLTAALDHLSSPWLAGGAHDDLGPTWAAALESALRSLDRERQLWFLLALQHIDVEEIDEWLAADITLADEEREFLTALSCRAKGVADELRRVLPARRTRGRLAKAKASEVDVPGEAASEIRRLLRQRTALLTSLRSVSAT